VIVLAAGRELLGMAQTNRSSGFTNSQAEVAPAPNTQSVLTEYSTVVPDAVTVQFIGYYADGSAITTSFTTDGIIDGTGPLADFQTFNFGSGWTGLTRVEVPGYGWSLDNLVVAVPEPTSGALLLLGGLVLWQARRPSGKASRAA
jgi:hypothetical protein